MLRASLAFVALGFFASAPAFAADEAYTLKLYQSKKGDKTNHEKSETSKTTLLINIGGNEMKEETGSEKEVFTEEILEKTPGARWSTKLTRTYSVAEKTEKGETTKAVYAGETVLIERKKDRYDLSIKGKALDESDAPELFKQFSIKKDDEPKDQDFLPDDPVKVGGSWKIPAEKTEKMFKTLSDDKMKIDAKKSTVEGKLLKAYKKDGAQFGVLEITITAFVSEIDFDGKFVKTAAGSKIVLKGTVDTCIDGTVPFEDSKIEMTMDITAEIPDTGSISIKVTTTGNEKARPAKK